MRAIAYNTVIDKGTRTNEHRFPDPGGRGEHRQPRSFDNTTRCPAGRTQGNQIRESLADHKSRSGSLDAVIRLQQQQGAEAKFRTISRQNGLTLSLKSGIMSSINRINRTLSSLEKYTACGDQSENYDHLKFYHRSVTCQVVRDHDGLRKAPVSQQSAVHRYAALSLRTRGIAAVPGEGGALMTNSQQRFINFLLMRLDALIAKECLSPSEQRDLRMSMDCALRLTADRPRHQIMLLKEYVRQFSAGYRYGTR